MYIMYFCVYIVIHVIEHCIYTMYLQHKDSQWRFCRFNELYKVEWVQSVVLSLFGCTQSLCLYERHPVCPHVSVQVSLGFKHLPTHLAFSIWRPVTVLVRNIQLVLSLTLLILLALSSIPGEAVRLLQPVNDKEVSGQRAVGGVAQAALLTLVRWAVTLVLRNVIVESGDVFGGEAADSTLVNFEDVHLKPLQWLWCGAPGVQPRTSLIIFCLPFGAEAL